MNRLVTTLLLGLLVVPAVAQTWRYPVQTEDGVALIDENGAIQGDQRFDEAMAFVGPLGPAKRGGSWGYVNGAGRWVIEPRFEAADRFTNGYARVRSEEGWTIIDPSGQPQTSRHYVELNRLSEGISAYHVDEGGRVPGTKRRSGLISTSGVELTEPIFDGAGIYSDGRIPVQVFRKFLVFKLERQWGYADSTGAILVRPAYSSGRPFSEGLALVSDGRGAGFINTEGEPVLTVEYAAAGSFHDGRARVGQNGRWGFIDQTGAEVVPLEYVAVGEFSDGLAAVRSDDLWGYIDSSGREVIPARFNVAGRFQGPLARVATGGVEQYIDRTGSVVWPRD